MLCYSKTKILYYFAIEKHRLLFYYSKTKILYYIAIQKQRFLIILLIYLKTKILYYFAIQKQRLFIIPEMMVVGDDSGNLRLYNINELTNRKSKSCDDIMRPSRVHLLQTSTAHVLVIFNERMIFFLYYWIGLVLKVVFFKFRF